MTPPSLVSLEVWERPVKHGAVIPIRRLQQPYQTPLNPTGENQNKNMARCQSSLRITKFCTKAEDDV